MDELDKKIKKISDALSVEDYERALSILSPLVKTGVPEALSILGAMYQLGQGVPRNLPKAVEILTKAYEKGDGVAAHNLGTIYAMGEDEIIKDKEKSLMYYKSAKELGAQFAPDEFYE